MGGRENDKRDFGKDRRGAFKKILAIPEAGDIALKGRKPKPGHLKLLEGNPGCREIGKEVQPTLVEELPDPPATLTTEEARREWLRLRRELVRLGLVTSIDVTVFEAYCQSYGRWVVAERALAALAALDPQTHGLMIRTVGGNAIQNPLVGTANAAMREFVRYAVELGCTPSARARIAMVPRPQTASKFSGLVG